jgi:hypothetical protein
MRFDAYRKPIRTFLLDVSQRFATRHIGYGRTNAFVIAARTG